MSGIISERMDREVEAKFDLKPGGYNPLLVAAYVFSVSKFRFLFAQRLRQHLGVNGTRLH